MPAFTIDKNSQLILEITKLNGRLIIDLDGTNIFDDANLGNPNPPLTPTIRVLVPGSHFLDFTARKSGNTDYDSRVKIITQVPGQLPTLQSQFGFSDGNNSKTVNFLSI